LNLRTLSLREAQRRPGRSLLTLLGIALGLATLVATRLTIRTVHSAYRDLFDSTGGSATLEVMASGGGSFDPEIAAPLASVPGVRAVIPHVQGVAAVAGLRGNVSVPVVGMDCSAAPHDDWEIHEGKQLSEEAEALLDSGLAHALGVRPGDILRLWAPTGPDELRLAGIAHPRQAAPGGLLIVPLARAQRLFGLSHRVHSLQVVPTDESDLAHLQSEIARRLPDGLVVQPPGLRGGLGRQTLAATEQALDCLGALALITAVFVTLNTFLLNFGERRQQLAILRLLGATAGQVRRQLLGEALLLGLVGAAGGVAMGAFLARALVAVMEQFLGVALPHQPFSAGPFVLAGLLGPGLAVAAAWLPTRWASKRQPLEELHPQGGARGEQPLRWLGGLGAALLGVGGVLAFFLCRDGFPAPAGKVLLGPALALLMAGGVLGLPLTLGPLLRLAGLLPLGRLGNLARLPLARHPGRTGLTAGVLFLVLAAAVGFGHTVRAILTDLRHWCRHAIVADFLVRASMPDTSFLLAPALPETLGAEIAQSLPGAIVDKIAFLPATAGDRPVLVLARAFAPGRPLPLDLHEGEPGAVRDGLARGEAVLGTVLAADLGLHRGDFLTLNTVHGPESIRVAGTATEYAGGGSALYLDWAAARRMLGVPGVHVFLVSAGQEAPGPLGPALEQFCEQHRLLLQSNADLCGAIERLLGRATAALWALMALAFVVASLGIVNTLMMNVRDQAREFGVLRALGLTRGQLCRLVLAQGLVLGTLSLLPGGAAGVGLAYLVNRGMACLGPPLPFRLDGPVLAGSCTTALAVALLASLVPARRAARLPVVRALQ
jgi:putative ABC transport system permease protein